MKLLPLALALCITVAARADYTFRQSFSETHPFNTSGEITLTNTNGAIVVQTWDRPEVKIEGEKRAQTDEELKLIEMTIDASPSTLVVKTNLPKRDKGWFGFGSDTIRAEVRFTLTVPATARLRKIDAVNGAISIDGVRGPVTARTVNGGLTVKGLAADTTLETVNGSIRAEFSALANTQSISTRTVNGSTTLGLPRDASVALRASSVNGSISCDLPITLSSGKSRTHLAGNIGSGATSLKVETVNGSIHVNSL